MLKGIPVSGGAAIGKILKIEEESISYHKRAVLGAQAEQARYEQALRSFTHHTENAAGAIRRIVGKSEADIFTGHIYMAHDPEMKRQIRHKIVSGYSAEFAMESACESIIAHFLSADSALTRQRAADVKDVKQAMLGILTGREKKHSAIPFGSVLAARELTPSAVEFIDRRRTVAVTAELGEAGSHFAILMRAMGIPTVLSLTGLMQAVETGQKVLVDGNSGEVIRI